MQEHRGPQNLWVRAPEVGTAGRRGRLANTVLHHTGQGESSLVCSAQKGATSKKR